jgi:predicted ester cyclase
MEGMRQDYRALHTAFPDLRYTVDDILAEGDKVVVRGTLRGTHTGSLFGLAPTGRPVTVTDIGVFRIAGGKIVEWWHQQDDLGLMTQIGQMPPAGAGH